MASLSTCLFLQYFYTCLFRMSGSIRLGRPNFAIKIFFKFNHDCFFLFKPLWGWLGCKSMRVGRQVYGCENRQHCVKKILTRLFPKHMTSILSLVDLRLLTLVFMHLRKQIHSWFFAISWFASGLMKWYWKFSWSELKEADLMSLSLLVLQGFLPI